jgi:uncharacterized iron-regulated membrane protein
MKFIVFTRKAHWWIAFVVLLPLLLVVLSGLMLQVKKQWSWVQPAECVASSATPALGLAQVLPIARGVSGSGVENWSDITRIDVRPTKNLLKVTTATGQEIQIDSATGAVLQLAPRNSDFIESLHDGSFFGQAAKLGLFLPVGFGLFLLLLSGAFLLGQRFKRRPA